MNDEDRYNVKRAKPSYLGVYIYSHARQLMYDNVYSVIDTEYTDTDSALCTRKQELLLREKRPHLFVKEAMEIDGQIHMIKQFGTLDCELPRFIQEAILIAPKNYLVGDRWIGGCPKLKCKGVSFKGDTCRYSEENMGYDQMQLLSENAFRLFDSLL